MYLKLQTVRYCEQAPGSSTLDNHIRERQQVTASTLNPALLPLRWVEIPCMVRTLSNALREIGISSTECVDLLKVDVEGHELQVLRGIDHQDWPRIRQIVIEVHNTGEQLQDIRQLLTRKGFTVRDDSSEFDHEARARTNNIMVYASKCT